MSSLAARALHGLPEVRRGDDLAALILAALGGERLHAGEVVAIAQKVVSKSQGAIVQLADVRPSARAIALAAAPPGGQAKDPRAVQVVLDQSTEVLRAERGVLVCRTHHGFVCANAGVDASNLGDGAGEQLVLLPRDPDASARRIRARLRELSGWSEHDGVAPAVLISDSFGRAWRHGQLDVAIGLAGMQPLDDWRGRTDAAGRELHATWLAVADAAAGAADLVRAKDSREPVALIEGLERFVTDDDGPGAGALLRAPGEDLFR
ncbi:MAG TPA: coenzyme F420-0:L-glutamate ligase [Solirubrobacteraceae bacterium]|nr:coenzyme F420-0:L-glutamate ligase [Solirubrobacteraceae bacterium]